MIFGDIPALNEGETIRVCIGHIDSGQSNLEVIVVDAWSSDDTDAIAETAGANVIQTVLCRGLRCNYGAADVKCDND